MLLVMAFAACGRHAVDLQGEKDNITKCWTDWEAKGATGDPELMAYYWAEDAMVMGPGQPTVKGKDSLRDMVANLRKIPGFKMTWDKQPSSIVVSADGQMAYLLARNEMVMPDSTGTPHSAVNQALQVWKKDGEGNWKAAMVMMYPVK